MFLIQVETEREGPWYRYHHLFRGFLNLTLRQRDPARYRELHRRAGRWFAEQGDAEAAVAHLLEAGDIEGAIAVMEGTVWGIFAAGRLETLRQWVQALPPERLQRSPCLLLYHAKLLADTGRPEAALALLDQAEAACSPQDLLTPVEIAIQRASTFKVMGRYEDAERAVESALAHCPPAWAHPVAAAYRLRGFARLALGRPRRPSRTSARRWRCCGPWRPPSIWSTPWRNWRRPCGPRTAQWRRTWSSGRPWAWPGPWRTPGP